MVPHLLERWFTLWNSYFIFLVSILSVKRGPGAEVRKHLVVFWTLHLLLLLLQQVEEGVLVTLVQGFQPFLSTSQFSIVPLFWELVGKLFRCLSQLLIIVLVFDVLSHGCARCRVKGCRHCLRSWRRWRLIGSVLEALLFLWRSLNDVKYTSL